MTDLASGTPSLFDSGEVHLLTGTGSVGATKCNLTITRDNIDDIIYTIHYREVTCTQCGGAQ